MGTLIGSTFRNALALQTNGSTQYAYKDNPSWKADTSGAISFWTTIPSLLGANGSKVIVGYGANDGANDAMWSFRQVRNSGIHPTNNYFAVLVRNPHAGTVNYLAATTTPLAAGTRYHVVVSSNGSTASIWINGVAQTITILVGSNIGTWFGDIAGADHRFTVGCNWIANAALNFYDGKIDEINIFSAAITSGQISALYNAGNPQNPHAIGFGAEWKTWLRCGDSRDDATTMYDERGTDNFTLVGSPPYVAP
jgi:hypothetical protein